MTKANHRERNKDTEGKSQRENHRAEGRQLSASESDLVKLTRWILGASFAIALAFAIGFYFAGKPSPATWFGALTLMLMLLTLESIGSIA